MATFDDISGWREELADYKASDEGKAYYNRYPLSSPEPVPVVSSEIPIRLAELLVTHAELRSAIEAIVDFEAVRAQHPEVGPGHPEWHKHPLEAYKTVLSFTDWYAMKVQEPYWAMSWHGCSRGLAEMFVEQKIDSIRTPAAYSYVNENYRKNFK